MKLATLVLTASLVTALFAVLVPTASAAVGPPCPIVSPFLDRCRPSLERFCYMIVFYDGDVDQLWRTICVKVLPP